MVKVFSYYILVTSSNLHHIVKSERATFLLRQIKTNRRGASASGRTERTCPNQLNKLVWLSLLVESPSSSTRRKSLGQDSRAPTQQS